MVSVRLIQVQEPKSMLGFILDYLVNTGFYVKSKNFKLMKQKIDMTDLIDLVDNKKIYIYQLVMID